jgi:hypothetical protein
MATGVEVLNYLLPDGGWYIVGDDYEGIQFLQCEPITKKQFTDGFAQYDGWKAKQDADKASAKSVLLAKLGITEDEAKLLLS